MLGIRPVSLVVAELPRSQSLPNPTRRLLPLLLGRPRAGCGQLLARTACDPVFPDKGFRKTSPPPFGFMLPTANIMGSTYFCFRQLGAWRYLARACHLSKSCLTGVYSASIGLQAAPAKAGQV